MAKAATKTEKTKPGKGIANSIPSEEARANSLNEVNGNGVVPQRTLLAIPMTEIVVSPFDPQAIRRARFQPNEILELAAGIALNGLLQPIKVRPVEVKGK